MPGLLRSIYRAVASDHVTSGGVVLPAKHLRLGGKEFKDDRFFLASARSEARRLIERCGFTPGQRALDFGCGVGRLPIGMLAEFGETTGYEGVDVDEDCVRWCKRHIERRHPGFHFHRIDAANRRYNPEGRTGCDLPFERQTFDVIYLYSVFSHMLVDDVNGYLQQFARILKPTGCVFLTAFVEEGVPDVSENPEGYRMQWSGPLHCVRYKRSFFEDLLRRAGFRMKHFEYGRETDGQSAIYCAPLEN
jgi:SAM-dependent methyltransferase